MLFTGGGSLFVPRPTNKLSGQNAEVLGVTLDTKITFLCDLKTEK